MVVAYGVAANFLISVGIIGAGGVVLGGIGGLLGAAYAPLILHGFRIALVLEEEPIAAEEWPRYESAVTLCGALGGAASLVLALFEHWGILA